MKEAELRRNATCSICKKQIGHTGLPSFWRVSIERFALDVGACERLQGLSMQLGSPLLASVMGPDEDLAVPLMDKAMLTVCESCALKSDQCIAVLAEDDQSDG